MLALHIASMPFDFIKVGDKFDLSVDARDYLGLYEQTVVLARGGNLIVFAASLPGHGHALVLPRLDSFGVQFADRGGFCQGPPSTVIDPSKACYPIRHAVRVATACASADLTEGQTVDLGGLSFTVGQSFTPSGPGCSDAEPQTTMGAFRLP